MADKRKMIKKAAYLMFDKFSIKNFLMLLIAGTINAFGVTVFLMPVRLYDSGISGTSMLLAQITPHWLTLSIFLVILNVPLFIFGLKRQGVVFTVYSLFAVAVYSTVSHNYHADAFRICFELDCYFKFKQSLISHDARDRCRSTNEHPL